MTQTGLDEMAAWYFNLQPLKDLDEIDLKLNVYPYEHLLIFLDIINIFKESRVLIPKKILFLRGQFGDSEIDICNIETKDILYKVLKEMVGNEYSGTLLVKGFTELLLDREYKPVERVIEIGFEFGLGRIQIISYADCWIPIDRDDNLQIELALDSSQRLEDCLKTIASTFDLIDQEPSKNEEITSNILPQKGLKVYTYEDISGILGIDNNLKSDLKKYMWKYRNDYH